MGSGILNVNACSCAWLQAYQKKVKELEAKLFELRSNSVPLRDHKELTRELASECDNVRRFAEEHIMARFTQQSGMIDELKRERDTARDRVGVLENQLQRQKTGLDKGAKSAAALQSRVKMLESELDAARRRVDVLMMEKEEAAALANELQVRNKYLQQERDETEAELHGSERDIAKLKSVIKVATDAVRKAAEQRQSDAQPRAREEGGDHMLRLQVLELAKERDDLTEKMRASMQREAYAVKMLESARAGEADALQQLVVSYCRASACLRPPAPSHTPHDSPFGGYLAGGSARA